MKRSQEKRFTKQAKVLRFMRMSRKVSMREAGRRLNLSCSWVSHIEQGRMDLSEKAAKRLVEAYGFTWKEYETLLSGGDAPFLDLKDECIGLLDRIDETKLRAVHAVLRGFVT